MIIHEQFYDGIVGKPDLDDALEHYGIKGMKWHRRKSKSSGGASQPKKQPKQKYHSTKKISTKNKRKYVTQKVAQDIVDGKYKMVGYMDARGKDIGTLKDSFLRDAAYVDGVKIYKKDVDEAIKEIENRKGRVGTSSHKF